MARKKGEIVNGWINFDKPVGLTSTEAVARVRRLLNAQKAGHGGTLDPLATGMLPIALGEATKTIPFCQDHSKEYSFTVRWGEERETDDAEGAVSATSDVRPTAEAIQSILPRFMGEIEQLPPRYSAIKIDGERAYDLARAGEVVEMPMRMVRIDDLKILEIQGDAARFGCVCGKGTYIRSLGRDMARALGTVGHIVDLRREAVGPFSSTNAISLERLAEITHSALLPVETVLDDIPALALNEREVVRLRQGQLLSFISRPDVERLHQAGISLEGEVTALAIYEGKPIALVSVSGPNVQPLRVLNL